MNCPKIDMARLSNPSPSSRVRHELQHLFQLCSWLLTPEREMIMSNYSSELCKPCVRMAIITWAPLRLPHSSLVGMIAVTIRVEVTWLICRCDQVWPDVAIERLLHVTSYFSRVSTVAAKLSYSSAGTQSLITRLLEYASDDVSVQLVSLGCQWWSWSVSWAYACAGLRQLRATQIYSSTRSQSVQCCVCAEHWQNPEGKPTRVYLCRWELRWSKSQTPLNTEFWFAACALNCLMA